MTISVKRIKEIQQNNASSVQNQLAVSSQVQVLKRLSSQNPASLRYTIEEYRMLYNTILQNHCKNATEMLATIKAMRELDKEEDAVTNSKDNNINLGWVTTGEDKNTTTTEALNTKGNIDTGVSKDVPLVIANNSDNDIDITISGRNTVRHSYGVITGKPCLYIVI